MTYQPEHLKRWTLPDSYAGAHWPDYFVFLGQHRDSDTLTRSNFTCGLDAIGGETETVKVIRERHWAVGWVEWIAIHQSDATALQKADEIAAGLEDYPVVNEDHWSELEYNEAWEYWAGESVSHRVYLCQQAGISVFAARRQYVEESSDPSGALYETLRELVN